MSSTPPVPPIYTKDDYGNAVVRVTLADGERVAVILEEDYSYLKANNAHYPWLFNKAESGIGYVRIASRRFPGRLETVARLIMRPPPGYVVAYRSQDHLDLRRSNLYLRSGKTRSSRPRRTMAANAFPRPSSPSNPILKDN